MLPNASAQTGAPDRRGAWELQASRQAHPAYLAPHLASDRHGGSVQVLEHVGLIILRHVRNDWFRKCLANKWCYECSHFLRTDAYVRTFRRYIFVLHVPYWNCNLLLPFCPSLSNVTSYFCKYLSYSWPNSFTNVVTILWLHVPCLINLSLHTSLPFNFTWLKIRHCDTFSNLQLKKK